MEHASFVAALEIYNSGKGKSLCAGSLIHVQWVLTAAHCFEGEQYTDVSIGGLKLGGDFQCKSTSEASDWFVHPDFVRISLDHDIALLRLKHNCDNLRRAVLPPKGIRDDDEMKWLPLTSAGFGLTDKKVRGTLQRTVDLQWLPRDQCPARRFIRMSESKICTKAEKNFPSGVCRGDSGGPLFSQVWHNNGQQIVFGVVTAFVGKACTKIERSWFTRVAHYTDWLERVIDVNTIPEPNWPG